MKRQPFVMSPPTPITPPKVHRAEVQALPSADDHHCDHRVSQRGLEHVAEDGLQRAPHFPGHLPQGDHPGGRRQRGR